MHITHYPLPGATAAVSSTDPPPEVEDGEMAAVLPGITAQASQPQLPIPAAGSRTAITGEGLSPASKRWLCGMLPCGVSPGKRYEMREYRVLSNDAHH